MWYTWRKLTTSCLVLGWWLNCFFKLLICCGIQFPHVLVCYHVVWKHGLCMLNRQNVVVTVAADKTFCTNITNVCTHVHFLSQKLFIYLFLYKSSSFASSRLRVMSKLPSQFPVGKTHLTMISLMKNIMKSIKLQCFDDSRVIQLMSPFSGCPNIHICRTKCSWPFKYNV